MWPAVTPCAAEMRPGGSSHFPCPGEVKSGSRSAVKLTLFLEFRWEQKRGSSEAPHPARSLLPVRASQLREGISQGPSALSPGRVSASTLLPAQGPGRLLVPVLCQTVSKLAKATIKFLNEISGVLVVNHCF